MKKISFIFLFIIFSLFKFFANSLDDDCLYLENLFSEVSIDMSLSLEENKLTTHNIINELKNIYKNTSSPKEEKKDGIDKKALANAINIIYSKYSNKNGHVSILSDDNFFVPFEHQFIYYSNVYFVKENNSFVVYENYKNIKKGMIYTGNTDNLFKTLYNNQTLYRYGVFSSTIIKDSIIKIDNREIKIPVSGDVGSAKYRKDYDFKEIDNCLYLKIEECHYSDKTFEKQFFKDSEAMIKNFKNYNSIIFDLRNNLGGFSKYLDQFSYALIYDKKTKENDSEFEKWSRMLYSNHKRINTRTMINKTKSVGLAPTDYINQCLNNLDQKYLIEATEEEIKITPWYKGKIYILTNPLTCSVAEEFSLILKTLFGNNVIIIGQNTNGSLDFADVYTYILPHSKIQLRLCAVDYRESNILKEASWKGDTLGIFPDYWCKPQDIITILSELTGNKKLKTLIKL